MIKLKSLINENIVKRNIVYHITPTKNIPSMKQHGIMPRPDKVVKFCPKVVCVFDDRTQADDAIVNWLSDKFDEDEPLSLLTIDARNLELFDVGVGYELNSNKTIPWKNVINIEKL